MRKPEEHLPGIEVALLMDSAVDIPEPTEKTLAIVVVPLQILLNDRYFRDKVEIGKEELYRRMRAEKDLVVKTSQPAPLDFKIAFESALARQAAGAFFQPFLAPERLVSRMRWRRCAFCPRPTRPASASSTRSMFRPAAACSSAAPCSSCSQGRSLEACRGGDREPAATDVVSLGYVESLEYAVRGGRLPPLAGAITRLLGIQPLVAFENGKLVKKGMLFGAATRRKKSCAVS